MRKPADASLGDNKAIKYATMHDPITKHEWLVIALGAIFGIGLMCIMASPTSIVAIAGCFLLGALPGMLSMTLWCFLMTKLPLKSRFNQVISAWLKEGRSERVLKLGVEGREAHPEDPKEKPENADGKADNK